MRRGPAMAVAYICGAGLGIAAMSSATSGNFTPFIILGPVAVVALVAVGASPEDGTP